MSGNDAKSRPGGLRWWWHRRSGTWWWATLVIVLPVAVITAAALLALLTFVDVGHDPKDWIEVIEIGLTVGAGTGGIVALVLTGWWQWATEHDNRECRLTELYDRAVEQLGSEKPKPTAERAPTSLTCTSSSALARSFAVIWL